MNNKHLLIVAVLAVMLIGATALSTTDSAFAGKKKYEKSQAASQANACGNGKMPLDVFCQNLLSQIQGDGNAVNIIGVQ
jgi:flagellar basal body-associated protein FliL